MSAPSPIIRMQQGRAEGEKFLLAQKGSVTEPNQLFLPFLCLFLPVQTSLLTFPNGKYRTGIDLFLMFRVSLRMHQVEC